MTRKHKVRFARALRLLGVERPRYMIVDAVTGEDLREAHGPEVEHIRRNANFSGVARLGTRMITIRRIEHGRE